MLCGSREKIIPLPPFVLQLASLHIADRGANGASEYSPALLNFKMSIENGDNLALR